MFENKNFREKHILSNDDCITRDKNTATDKIIDEKFDKVSILSFRWSTIFHLIFEMHFIFYLQKMLFSVIYMITVQNKTHAYIIRVVENNTTYNCF